MEVVDGCGTESEVCSSVPFPFPFWSEGGHTRGVVVVGEGFTKFSISAGASWGVTFSTTVKLGRSRTFVGWLPVSCMWYSSGTGMFEAESLRRYIWSFVSFRSFVLVFGVLVDENHRCV